MKLNKRKTRPAGILKRIKAKFREEPGTPTGFYPRKLARSVAKANMARAGVQHINRNFSLNWRNWVHR